MIPQKTCCYTTLLIIIWLFVPVGSKAQDTIYLKNKSVHTGEISRFFNKRLYLKKDNETQSIEIKKIRSLSTPSGQFATKPIQIDLRLSGSNRFRGYILSTTDTTLELFTSFSRRSYDYSEINRITKLKRGNRTDPLGALVYSISAWLFTNGMITLLAGNYGDNLKTTSPALLPGFFIGLAISRETYLIGRKKRRLMETMKTLQNLD